MDSKRFKAPPFYSKLMTFALTFALPVMGLAAEKARPLEEVFAGYAAGQKYDTDVVPESCLLKMRVRVDEAIPFLVNVATSNPGDPIQGKIHKQAPRPTDDSSRTVKQRLGSEALQQLARQALRDLKVDAGVLIPLIEKDLTSSEPSTHSQAMRILACAGANRELTVLYFLNDLRNGNVRAPQRGAGTKKFLAEAKSGLFVRIVGRSRIQLRSAQIKQAIDQIESAISTGKKSK